MYSAKDINLTQMTDPFRYVVRRYGEYIGDIILKEGRLFYSLPDETALADAIDAIFEQNLTDAVIVDDIQISKPDWEKETVFYIIRHGETELNIVGGVHIQGWADSPLTEKGIAQAEDAAARMRGIHLTAAVSSTSKRAIDTLKIVLGRRKLPVHTFDDLREVSFGIYDRLLAEDVLPDMKISPVGFGFCGGEDYTTVVERFLRRMRILSCSGLGDSILLASHGNAIYRVLEAIDPTFAHSGLRPWELVKNGGVYKVSIKRGVFTYLGSLV